MNAQFPHLQRAFAAPDAINFEALAVHGALHEILSARPADAAAATCFALGLLKQGRLFWLRQKMAQMENGALYAPGLATLGLDPSQLVFLTLHDAQSVLQAGLEAARISSLAAVIVELWGAAKPYTLTASRKLALAAKASGTKVCVISHATEPSPSAAETRWQVKRLPSQALAGNAPSLPAFEVTLLRHRGSAHAGQVWCVEWNNEKRCFEIRSESDPNNVPPLFEPVVSLPAIRKVPSRKAA